MDEALAARLADSLAQDRGLAAEFMVYMALLRLPPPRRLFFNYRIMGPDVTLAEIDLLLLTSGGLFVIEVKSRLTQVNTVARNNEARVHLLRQLLGNAMGKLDFPVHSLAVYFNERADKWVWAQNATYVTHRRFLLPTIAWLTAQETHYLDASRIAEIADRLRTIAKTKHKLPKSKSPPQAKAAAKPPVAVQPAVKQNPKTKQKTEETSMVHRIFTGRREGFDMEAQALLQQWRGQLHTEGLTGLAVYNRYDVEGIDEALLQKCIPTVFSEPQTDVVYETLPPADILFAVEYLPGQYDQRADSCAQCIQIVSGGQRPLVRTAKVYALSGKVSVDEMAAIRKSVINPVECRLARPEKPATLQLKTEPPAPVKTLDGFTGLDEDGLAAFLKEYGLAMDLDDLKFCQGYFQAEKRDPTVTEIRMIDTYWSDHCRHTTFLTHLDGVQIDDPKVQRTWERYRQIKRELGRERKPDTLMELATQAMRYLKHTGQLKRLDESEEINACTVTMDIAITPPQACGPAGDPGDGQTEPWLFLFKNETHNHPTEIEPFGGAATCIGGAIRDPLSGRGYVYQAMRVTGAADPTVPMEQTLPGKLPQRRLTVTAAQGYSSYGNQIGLATGLVDEIYHPGYAAKRMEIGAVVAAVPQAQVRREAPLPGDKVILLGGRTGRDGCGGATGSSKSHTLSSLETCGAEVQKGNAPEERKLQRLFRNPEASRMIKRCNDFGAGGVSVAIGELCDGLVIDLDTVPKKYEGLDGTELAISESQERMAIVVEPGDVEKFIALADGENLEATVVAEVQEAPRLVMKWNGQVIVDIAREFLNSNGAEKHARAHVPILNAKCLMLNEGTFAECIRDLADSLAVCSRRGLSERFDSTIGAGTVLMPFGGKYQQTPSQVMAAKIPVQDGETDACSVMAYGYDPCLTGADPYRGAYCAVVESIAKLAAAGCPLDQCYLTFQEYFERMTGDPVRWGKPLAALLGAMQAQLDLGIASIGGKDSMSGSFEQLDVPPTLVSFAVALTEAKRLLSNEFKRPGSRVAYIAPPQDDNGLPLPEETLKIFRQVAELAGQGKVLTAQAITSGGTAEAVLKMGLGNKIGFAFDPGFPIEYAFPAEPGAILLELAEGCEYGSPVGRTIEAYEIRAGEEVISLAELEALYENKLEPVFPMQAEATNNYQLSTVNCQLRSNASPIVRTAKPRVFIPVFPGTNCEYDTARAFEKAGAMPEVFVINNKSAQGLADSVERAAKALGQAQILFLPGGFSGGDEPDGSGKFITAFLRNPRLSEAVADLLGRRMGLAGGICNGFQALVKLGLVPFGEIREMTPECPTLTFNTIGRHQSKLVRTRVASVLSPWLALCEPGEVHLMPISHGEGRFVCAEPLLQRLVENGQVATQYVDLNGAPSMDIQYNPNGSVCAIEGITSPDGRVFGKMGHSERVGPGLYKNVPGNTDNKMFRAAVEYYK